MAQRLMPEPEDYFVLKPKHSGFFASTLDVLLRYLQVRTVVLTGVATNLCVLYTANDAYMRDFGLVVPSDCVASNSEQETQHALEQMQAVLKADIRPAYEISFDELARASERQTHHERSGH